MPGLDLGRGRRLLWSCRCIVLLPSMPQIKETGQQVVLLFLFRSWCHCTILYIIYVTSLYFQLLPTINITDSLWMCFLISSYEFLFCYCHFYLTRLPQLMKSLNIRISNPWGSQGLNAFGSQHSHWIFAVSSIDTSDSQWYIIILVLTLNTCAVISLLDKELYYMLTWDSYHIVVFWKQFCVVLSDAFDLNDGDIGDILSMSGAQHL